MHGLLLRGRELEDGFTNDRTRPSTTYHLACAFQTLGTNLNHHHKPTKRERRPTCPVLLPTPSLSLSFSFVLWIFPLHNSTHLFPATLIHSSAREFLSSVVRLSPSPVEPFTAQIHTQTWIQAKLLLVTSTALRALFHLQQKSQQQETATYRIHQQLLAYIGNLYTCQWQRGQFPWRRKDETAGR